MPADIVPINQDVAGQIDTQKAKLNALETFYAQYKDALTKGQQPPALPSELAGEGFFGITPMMLMMGAVAFGLWAMFNKE